MYKGAGHPVTGWNRKRNAVRARSKTFYVLMLLSMPTKQVIMELAEETKESRATAAHLRQRKEEQSKQKLDKLKEGFLKEQMKKRLAAVAAATAAAAAAAGAKKRAGPPGKV